MRFKTDSRFAGSGRSSTIKYDQCKLLLLFKLFIIFAVIFLRLVSVLDIKLFVNRKSKEFAEFAEIPHLKKYIINCYMRWSYHGTSQ